ncbi:MAG TPA: PxKF domain-containing protein, partial [Gemmatimonadaceae bacterium]|nr:PxKF domain-containing protein [Gemmatimonadaceae bacterium]
MSRLPTAACLLALFAVVTLAACDRDPVGPVVAPTAPRATASPGSGDIVAPMVSSGMEQTCALFAAGNVQCWGFNTYLTPALTGQTAVSAGGYGPFACALSASGVPTCWGDNSVGQTSGAIGLTNIRQVSAGYTFACALRSDGTVACWGEDYAQQTVVPPGLSGVVQISAGIYHACALKDDGTVTCWGYTFDGQPAQPAGLTGVTQVSASGFHTCARRSDGTVACWGGDGSLPEITPPAGLTHVVEVSTGYGYSCALRDDGTVVCWGANRGTGAPMDPPAGLTDAMQISAGMYHACALERSGTVVCWGYTGYNAFVPSYVNLLIQQWVTFTSAPPSPAVYGGSYVVAATGGSSGSPVTFASGTPAVCDVVGTTVHFVGAGGCTITADQAGAVGFAPAPQVSQSFTVQKAPQVVAFATAAPNPAFVGTSYTVNAMGGGSGNAVTVGTLTPAVCSAAGSVVTLGATGLCTVTANQAGDANYLPAVQVTQSFVVSKVPQVITFTSPTPNPALLGASFVVAATGGASGNPVVFSSLTPAVCVLSGTTVSLIGVGSCTVAADQAGNATYLAAVQVTRSVQVVFPFTGYDAFANLPTLNQARAGSTVSLDFSLGGDRGLAVLGAGSPTSVSLPDCGTTPSGLEAPRSVTNRTLSYNKRTGNYSLSFSSDKAWLGTCRQLVMRLADGTEHRAN